MIYIAVDLETTGLDPSYCQILEIGLIIDDTNFPEIPIDKLPTFHCLVKHKRYVGEAFAFAMNSDILYELAKKPEETTYKIYNPINAVQEMANFLSSQGVVFPGSILAAGKNVGSFDYQFLKQLPNFIDMIKFEYSFLDPGSLYFDPKIDKKVPHLKVCIERLRGVTEIKQSHRGLDDAMMVIELLRAKWRI